MVLGRCVLRYLTPITSDMGQEGTFGLSLTGPAYCGQLADCSWLAVRVDNIGLVYFCWANGKGHLSC